MTTIFYKKLLGRYEIAEINEHGGGNIQIKFEEPIDGSLIICDLTLPLMRGACKIESSKLGDGYAALKLYTGGLMQTIEGFIVKKGEIIRKGPDEEYVRRLSQVADTLLSRVENVEKHINKIENKIEQRIIF